MGHLPRFAVSNVILFGCLTLLVVGAGEVRISGEGTSVTRLAATIPIPALQDSFHEAYNSRSRSERTGLPLQEAASVSVWEYTVSC